jgi:hypothetical protein
MPPEYFFPMLGMTFALAWGVIGTVRWYLRQKLHRAELPGDYVAHIRELEARVAELEERVDFTERILSRHREELGP